MNISAREIPRNIEPYLINGVLRPPFAAAPVGHRTDNRVSDGIPEYCNKGNSPCDGRINPGNINHKKDKIAVKEVISDPFSDGPHAVR